MPDAVRERIKANNARFRDANERIRDRAGELGVEMERIPFLCECPVEECVEIVHLTPGEYAVVEYTDGKVNIQTWDFAYKTAR